MSGLGGCLSGIEEAPESTSFPEDVESVAESMVFDFVIAVGSIQAREPPSENTQLGFQS